MSRSALLLLCVSPLVAAPVPKALKNKPTLEGTWQVVECSYGAEKNGKTPWGVWTVSGDKLTALSVKDVDELRGYGDKKPYSWSFKLRFPDPDDPTTVDLMEGDEAKPKVLRGRLTTDDDTLKLCYPNNPTEERPVECVPAPRMIYHTFTRVDSEKLKAK